MLLLVFNNNLLYVFHNSIHDYAITSLLISKITNSISLSYRCLICQKSLESPHKLEVHLQIEHNWDQKREPKGLDNWI